ERNFVFSSLVIESAELVIAAASPPLCAGRWLRLSMELAMHPEPALVTNLYGFCDQCRLVSCPRNNMQTRCLFEKPGNLASALAREISRPGELGWRNFFCKRFAASGLPGCGWTVAIAMLLASSSPAHEHGANHGGQDHQQPSH